MSTRHESLKKSRQRLRIQARDCSRASAKLGLMKLKLVSRVVLSMLP